MANPVYLTRSPVQSLPVAGTLTTLYTVPPGYQADMPSAQICNQASALGSFRFSIAPGGAADARSQYIYYDVPLQANDSLKVDVGMRLSGGDQVRVYSNSGQISFTLYREEASQVGVG